MQDNPQPHDPAADRTPPEEFGARLFAATPRVFWTPLLVCANFAVFGAMIASGVSPLLPQPQQLIDWGADFGPLTTSGDWWRLLTCAFVHVGVIHIAMNMWVLWDIGRIQERIIGRSGFIVIYLISAVMASLTSLLWRPEAVSAGASGAIFGVYGSFLGFLIRQRASIPPPVLSRLWRGAFWCLAINIGLGLSIPVIDMAAHTGGFLTGFACGLALAHPLSPEGVRGRLRRSLMAAVYGGALAALSAYVMQKPYSEIGEAARAFEAKDYDRAIATLNKRLDSDGADAAAFNMRGMINLAKEDYAAAAKDLKEAVKIEQKLPGAHLMLGFALLKLDEDAEAEAAWRKAAEQGAAQNNPAATEEELRAGALQNIGLIHLKNGKMREALDHTTEVNRIKPGMAWNSLIRAIAADRLGEPVIARAAHETWMEAKKDAATLEIERYLPKEFLPYMKALPSGK